MIEFLSGILAEKQPTHAVVRTGGVGFRLLISLSAFDALPPTGEEVTLPTHLAVREDSLTLYGFSDTAERELFERLIQVSGIGPKLALTALSGLPSSELIRAIADGDVKRLSGISGIGKKMAERMVVELRDKLPASASPSAATRADPAAQGVRDALMALVALGYKQQEAKKLLDKLPESDRTGLTVEELVRRALRPS